MPRRFPLLLNFDLITGYTDPWCPQILVGNHCLCKENWSWSQQDLIKQSIVVSERSGFSFWTHGASLVVQRLRFCSSTAEGVGLIPAWGTKIQHGAWCG